MTVLACVVAFSLGIEFMVVVHNAMLPALVSEQRIGRWSGWSFAAGYFATVTALALVLCAPETLRLPGLPVLTREQASGPFMALWLAICMTPFFLWTPDRRRHESSVRSAIAEGLCSLGATFRTARHYSNIWRYMIARAIFYDGLLAIFLFSGIFAAGSYDWDIARLAALGIAQFLAAAIGAAILAPLDDRVGSKRMLMCSVTLVGCGTALLLLIAPHNPPAATESMRGPFLFLSQLGFATYSEQAYFLCTAATNFFLGPALAASRTMVARLAPHELMGQFFGLFSLLGRATSFAAPLIIGVTTAMTQSQRLGFATVLLFIVAGLLLLTTVREERSILAASDPRTDSGRHDRSG
jgi:UMF1 family MFS transporter